MKNLRGMTAQAVAAHNAHMRGKPLDPAVVPRELSLLPPRSYAFVVPMPPTVNDYQRAFVLNGHIAMAHTDECKRFRQQVEFICRRTLQFDAALGGRLELGVVLVFANRRRVDLDNRIKPLQDALKKGELYGDDSQIDRLIVERELTEGADEFCRVRVREIA